MRYIKKRAEHEGVLEIMREVRRRIAGGEMRYGPVLVQAIAEGFPLHAGSMDTVLALYIRESGFDAAVSGCGAGCAAVPGSGRR